ncbi:HzsA-related protein [Bacilliculturomica massiliensis]|uniref:HzsA-related protein n=1 Tax=Bacilliculturomica massiliensis TaxID=1917867 RepID=UPI00102F53CA|nr:hypothetical protein [Bacilliculturomica massiliensis]
MNKTEWKRMLCAALILCMMTAMIPVGTAYAAEKLVFNFESGTLAPFTMVTGNTPGPIGSRTTEFNSPQRNINKEGTYYLTSIEDGSGGYSDGYTAEFRSPLFVLTGTEVTFKVGGGTDSSKLYVALCDESGTVVRKATSPTNQYLFTDVTWDLSGAITPGNVYYLKIVDSSTGGWGHIIFDDFQAQGYVCEYLTDNIAKAVTGWDQASLEALRTTVAESSDSWSDPSEAEAVYLQISELQSRLRELCSGTVALDDPRIPVFTKDADNLKQAISTKALGLQGMKILFVTRQQYAGSHHNTHTMFPAADGEYDGKANFRPGSALKVLDMATGEVTTLMETATGAYRDPDVSYDGNRVLLSVRDSADSSYNIWEYTLNDSKTAIVDSRQLTAMKNADDMDPLYMPSGNIVFSSTRDPKYVMCNRHIAANLYRMEADGANIVKITNSTLFERPTDVLNDGRIIYDRWEYNDMNFGSAQGLWTVGEDGTQQVTYYGNNSPAGAVIDAKAIPGSQKVAAILSSCHDRPWGALAVIDRSRGVDGKDPVIRTWPASAINSVRDQNQGLSIDAYSGLSIKYEDPRPLDEDHIIVSRQVQSGSEKMGLYLVDSSGKESKLYVDDTSRGAYDATVLASRTKPIVLSERRNYKDEAGTFFVQNVYEGEHMQGVEKGTVKTLRIVESVPKRYVAISNQWAAEGQENPGVNWHSFEVKRVLGEVPVYSDGSAYFEVPQDKFVYFQLLDKDGKMIQSMRSGTLVQSGEKTGCVGCHEDRRITPDLNNPVKTPEALRRSFSADGVNVPDKPTLYEQTRGGTVYGGTPYEETKNMNYLTDVQPIFTAKCLDCHGYDRKDGNLTLAPDKGVIFNASYVDLWRARGTSARFGNYLGVIGAGSTVFTPAMSWGSYSSPLVKAVFSSQHESYLKSVGKEPLTAAEKRKIAEWVDLNATYYGDYSTNYPNGPGGRSPLSSSELSKIPGGLQWNFGWSESRAMPIYFDNPEKSPILSRWAVGSAEYNQALDVIRTGQQRLKDNPDVDMPGYTPRKEDAWRNEKVAIRDQIEAENRKAIDEGRKLYDWDHEIQDPLTAWPGWNQ